jgi:hypothetical protein
MILLSNTNSLFYHKKKNSFFKVPNIGKKKREKKLTQLYFLKEKDDKQLEKVFF